MIDVEESIEKLSKGDLLTEESIFGICQRAKKILVEEGNVMMVSGECTVVGDIHGQLFDLLHIF